MPCVTFGFNQVSTSWAAPRETSTTSIGTCIARGQNPTGFWIGETEVTSPVPIRAGIAASTLPSIKSTAITRMLIARPSGCDCQPRQSGSTRPARAYQLPVIACWIPSLGRTATAGIKPTNLELSCQTNSACTTLLGNVWEWVEDSKERSGKKQRILRDGSFFNPSRDIRVSNRLWALPIRPTATSVFDVPDTEPWLNLA